MAELGHAIVKVESNVDHTGDTDWHSPSSLKIPAGSLAGSTKYLVVVKALTGSASGNNNNDEFDLYHDGAEVEKSHQLHESRRSGGAQAHAYFWVGEITTPATAVDIQFRMKVEDASDTCRVKCFYAMALAVDTLSASHYKFQKTTPAGDAPTSWTGGATVTLPDDTDEWAVFYCAHFVSDQAASDTKLHLDIDGTDQDDVIQETEDSDEEYLYGFVDAHANVSSDVLTVEYAVENANTHDCDYTAIAAINMSAFKVGIAKSDTSDTSITSGGTWTTVSQWDDQLVGDGTHNFMVLGAGLCDQAESAKRMEFGVRYRRGAGSWETAANYIDSIELVSHGSGDQSPWVAFGEVTNIADSDSVDFALEAREHSDVTPNPVYIRGTLIAFTWELAAGVTNETGAVSAGAESGASFDAQAGAAGAISAPGEAGVSFTGLVSALAAFSGGGQAAQTFAGTAGAVASISAGAEAGHSVNAQAAAVASIVAGAEAGQVDGGTAAAAATLAAGATGDAVLDTIAQAAAALTVGAQAGESWAAQAEALASMAAGAEAGATIDATKVVVAALSAGTEAGAQFAAAAAALGDMVAGGNAGAAVVAVAATLATITEAGEADALMAGAAAAVAAIAGAAESDAALAATTAAVGALVNAGLAGATFTAARTAHANLAAAAQAGAVFTVTQAGGLIYGSIGFTVAVLGNADVGPALAGDATAGPALEGDATAGPALDGNAEVGPALKGNVVLDE